MPVKRRRESNSPNKTKKRSYAKLRKYWSSVHKHNKGAKCVVQTTKKYTSRSSPPYPANKCCGKTLKGNDGNKYVSEPGVSGICSWKRV